jgi:serine/threonine protein kinase
VVSDVEQSMAAPERSQGLAGSIVKGRYRVKTIAAVRRDVVVYRAEDVRSGRPITLEVLRDELAADQDFVSAVREQAWALAKSAHVHRGVARVYDCGTTDTGDVFVALEPTEGPTLRDVLEARRPLHPGTALRVASQLGEALETLHHDGTVHGQLDPESVLMVTDNDGGERVVLVGVELTAAYRTPLGRRLRESSSSPYVAPEQLERGETTEAADIYALGMLLREMLIPEQAGPTGVPPTIARIIATAVDTRPRHRYPDISTMINDMWGAQTAFPEAGAGARAVKAPSNGHPAAHRRPRRVRPGVVLGIAGVVVIAMIGAGLVWAALADRIGARFRARATPPAPVMSVEKSVIPEAARPIPEPPSAAEPRLAPGILPHQPPTALSVAPHQPPTPAIAPQPPTVAPPLPPQQSPAPPVVRHQPAVPAVTPQQPPVTPALAPQPPPAVVPQHRPTPAVQQPAVVRQQPPPAAPAASGAQRSVEPRRPADRPTTERPTPRSQGDVGDGSAIIDWLLKEKR